MRERVKNHVHAHQAHEANHEVLQELAEQVAVDDVIRAFCEGGSLGKRGFWVKGERPARIPGRLQSRVQSIFRQNNEIRPEIVARRPGPERLAMDCIILPVTRRPDAV